MAVFNIYRYARSDTVLRERLKIPPLTPENPAAFHRCLSSASPHAMLRGCAWEGDGRAWKVMAGLGVCLLVMLEAVHGRVLCE